MEVSKKRKLFIFLALLLIVGLLIYFFSYYFSKKHNKVIYQKDGTRIYLIKKEGYSKPGREIWRMVLEDRKTGKRSFVFANCKKGFSEKKMCAIILNTVAQNKKASFDQVESCGVTIRDAKTDVHSNLVENKNPFSAITESDFMKMEIFDNMFMAA